MKPFKRTITLYIALLLVTQINAQNNANALIQKVYEKLERAKDYSVDAHIKADIPFVRMIPVNAKIYYKSPGMFKVESGSIAVVPRQGFDMALKLLSGTDSFIAVKQGEEKIGPSWTSIVNIIPMADTGDVVLGKLWIDHEGYVIIKSVITTKSSGTVETQYSYGSMAPYGLPDKIIFTVDIKKFKIPREFSLNDDTNKPEKENNGTKDKKGRIYISLSNYEVNKGIPDKIFQK